MVDQTPIPDFTIPPLIHAKTGFMEAAFQANAAMEHRGEERIEKIMHQHRSEDMVRALIRALIPNAKLGDEVGTLEDVIEETISDSDSPTAAARAVVHALFDRFADVDIDTMDDRA